MTQRTRSTLPSTRLAARKATSGSRKSPSLESTPRIHQGFAPADPDRINEVRVSAAAITPAVRRNGFIAALYSSLQCDRRPSPPERCLRYRAFPCRRVKNYRASPLNRENLPLSLAAKSREC